MGLDVSPLFGLVHILRQEARDADDDMFTLLLLGTHSNHLKDFAPLDTQLDVKSLLLFITHQLS
jgi:hypothetical protein